MRYVLILIAALTMLTGCEQTTQAPDFSADMHAIQSMPDEKAALTEAAVMISQSLNDLKALEKASLSESQKKNIPHPRDYKMHELTSIEWSGPVEPLLQKIAHQYHYTFRTIGRAPSIPILVTLSAKNTPLNYIIRNADVQAGTKADIVVYNDAAKRIIELRYA